MTQRNWRRSLLYSTAVAMALFVTALLSASWAVGSGVREASDMAVREYGGDPVLALVTFAASPSQSLRDRNRAVWALGQMGDARALAFLESQDTGRECDHARGLCQHEVRKAIHLCRGGLNLTALVWRRGFVTPAVAS